MSPSEGVGIDFSGPMLDRARAQFTDLEFIEGDAHDLSLGERTFDYIILSDVINDVRDVQRVCVYSNTCINTVTRARDW